MKPSCNFYKVKNLSEEGIDVPKDLVYKKYHCHNPMCAPINYGRPFAMFMGYEISYYPPTGDLVATNTDLNHKSTINVIVKRTFCNDVEFDKLKNQRALYTVDQFPEEMKEIVECIMERETGENKYFWKQQYKK